MNAESSSLEAMCELIVDCPHSTPKWTDSGTIVLRNQNIRGGQLDLSSPSYTDEDGYQSRIKRATPRPGDIIFTREAPMGEVCLIPAGLKCCLGQRQVLLRPKSSVNGDYLYWALQSPIVQQQISWNEGTGTTVSNVRIPVLKALEIPRRGSDEPLIANILTSIANKIQLNGSTNQTLEQMAQAIFKSWFVDFNPVKAKIAALEAGGSEEDAMLAAMQAISGKDEAELTSLQAEQPEQYAELRATAELFPSAMQESELGDIPEGWEARPFGVLLEKTIGGDWGKEEPDEKHTEMVKILRGTDLPNVRAGDDGKVPTRYVEPKKLKTRSLKPGDIVIEVSGGSKGQPTGRSLFLTSRLLKRLGTCEPASFCRLFRPRDQETALVLGLHLQHIYAEGKTWLYQNQSTGISNFQTKVFLEHELVATPPVEVIGSFYKLVIPLIIRIHGDESAVLAAIRDSLLPKLLSGELSLTTTVFEPDSQGVADATA